jgi:hypothetical protein
VTLSRALSHSRRDVLTRHEKAAHTAHTALTTPPIFNARHGPPAPSSPRACNLVEEQVDTQMVEPPPSDSTPSPSSSRLTERRDFRLLPSTSLPTSSTSSFLPNNIYPPSLDLPSGSPASLHLDPATLFDWSTEGMYDFTSGTEVLMETFLTLSAGVPRGPSMSASQPETEARLAPSSTSSEVNNATYWL